MRYDNNNLSELTRLLDLYYSGESTPEQERRLFDIISETPSDMLPDDIRRQQPMFRSLRQLAPDSSAVRMPESVARRLDRYVDSLAASSRRRRTMIGMICGWVAGIAAAIAITVTLYNLPVNTDSASRTDVMAGGDGQGEMSSSDLDTVGRALRHARTPEEFRPMRVKDTQHRHPLGVKELQTTDDKQDIGDKEKNNGTSR